MLFGREYCQNRLTGCKNRTPHTRSHRSSQRERESTVSEPLCTEPNIYAAVYAADVARLPAPPGICNENKMFTAAHPRLCCCCAVHHPQNATPWLLWCSVFVRVMTTDEHIPKFDDDDDDDDVFFAGTYVTAATRCWRWLFTMLLLFLPGAFDAGRQQQSSSSTSVATSS